MNKVILLIFVAGIFISTTGCSTMERIITAGANANDQALDAAEFTICKAATVGSIRRRYGTKEQAETWRALCDSIEDDSFTPEE